MVVGLWDEPGVAVVEEVDVVVPSILVDIVPGTVVVKLTGDGVVDWL